MNAIGKHHFFLKARDPEALEMTGLMLACEVSGWYAALVRLFVCQSVCLSLCPSVCLSVCMPVSLSVSVTYEQKKKGGEGV